MKDAEFADDQEVWGWADCTEGGVIEQHLPGTNESMMTSPKVQLLADNLSQYLYVNQV